MITHMQYLRIWSRSAHSVLRLQASPDQKAKEVTHWLLQAYDELLEGWNSTEGESYAERYQVRSQLLCLLGNMSRRIPDHTKL